MALPMYEDVLANAAPGSRGEAPADVGSDDHAGDPNASELNAYATALDATAAQAGGAIQRSVAAAKPNWVGYAFGAYVLWRLLK